MTMKFEQYKYTLAQCWIAPLVYGDLDGLDDSEIRRLQDFIDALPEGPGHWGDFSEDSHFAHDEITGLFAECVDAVYLVSAQVAA
jgi:hypothetical protein